MTSSDVGRHHNPPVRGPMERSPPRAGGRAAARRSRSLRTTGSLSSWRAGRLGACAGRARRRSRSPGIAMGPWIVWLVLAAVLGVAEVMTTTLAFGPIAVGAVAAGVVGVASGGLAFPAIAFGVASAAGLGVVRPIAVRHIKQPAAAAHRDLSPGRALRQGRRGSHRRRRQVPHWRGACGRPARTTSSKSSPWALPSTSSRSRAPPHLSIRGSRHGNSRACSRPRRRPPLRAHGRQEPPGSCRAGRARNVEWFLRPVLRQDPGARDGLHPPVVDRVKPLIDLRNRWWPSGGSR